MLTIKTAERCQGHPIYGHFYTFLASAVFLNVEFKVQRGKYFSWDPRT